MKKKHSLIRIITFFLFLLTIQNIGAQTPAFDSLAREVTKTSIFHKTKSLEMLRQLYQMAYQSPDSALLISYCLYEESTLNFRQGIVDTLLTKKIKNRLKTSKLPQLEHALLQSALGTNLMSEKGYADAFPLHFEALETFKKLNNNRFTARMLNSLGNICYYFNLYKSAENYYTDALTFTNPENFDYYYFQINLFRAQSVLGNKAALDSLCAMPEIVIQKKIDELLPVLYLNIGVSLIEKDPDKAFFYFTKMQSLKFENPHWLSVLHSYLGSYYAEKKDYKNALHYYFDAMKVMEEGNDFFHLTMLFYNISYVFEQQHQYTKALFYSKKSRELMFRLRANMAAIETYQKYVDNYIETSKKELIIAEQTIELKNNQFIIIAVASVSVLLLILMILLYTHKQKQLKISENRELSKKLEYEKRVQQYEKRQRKLEKEKQKEIIDAKTRELTSYSLLVSNKNLILKQILDLTTQIFDDKDNSAKNVNKINQIVQNNLDIDDEWENFKMHFDKVHPHFFEKLKKLSENLTEENLRMCAYIKIRLTNKQIAQLLHVVPNTIITSRYRLKKKLQLKDEDDLDCFLGEL